MSIKMEDGQAASDVSVFDTGADPNQSCFQQSPVPKEIADKTKKAKEWLKHRTRL